MIKIKVYYINLKKHNISQKEGSLLIKNKVLGDREILFTKNGKPYTKDMFFNISHSEDLVVLALADCEIGIDIEKIRDVDFKIAEKYFDKVVSNNEEFFDIWTKKESVIKYLGKTLGSIKEINQDNYNLKTSDFFKGYALCICTDDKSEIEYIEI